MGYYVEFNLDITLNNEFIDHDLNQKIVSQFKEVSEDANDILDDDGDCKELSKWLNYRNELRHFSTNHPELLFTLHCKGQEGDMWNVYCKNGDIQVAYAETYIAPYDPNMNDCSNCTGMCNRIIDEGDIN